MISISSKYYNLSMCCLPFRRRCLIIYISSFLLSIVLIAHKAYKFSRTWTDADWEKLTPTEGIINYPHEYVIASNNPGCSNSTKLLIMIFSRPEAFTTRSTIRSTWLSSDLIGTPSDSNSALMHKFIIGKIEDPLILAKLAEESIKYGDIIIDATFTDSYQLLVRKTISMVHWVNTYCPKAEALLKADDDSWFNIKLFLKLLPVLEPGIHGHVYRYSGVSSNPKDPWYMPKEIYPFGHYPDFTSGSGYLIVNRGTNLLYKLLVNIATIRTIWTEDVFLTGLVAEKAKVNRYHHNGFNPTKRSTDDVCQYKTLLSSHKLTETDIASIYKSMMDPNLKC